ncbi:unnamed protein product [Moneuplotes crassus]|uniref:Uncharacterized protein n=1 Tax=Euplotes crassus TaxID=5936 RepID=A0AAD1X3L7_EUPCR|nr:unnamed protein product [Moneuplotes crassus]
MEEEERRLMQQEDKRILDDNVKSINCEIAPNLISIDDLKDKSILAFKGNLNQQDIKLLRQRKFVIKDKPTPSERISASSSLKEFHKTNPAHSNQRNPYIKHLLKPSKNMIKRLIEENKRKRALEISQTMEKFKDIICDRERLTNIRIKKEIKNSTSANRAKKNDEMFIKRIQQTRADSFERSVSRKARTQTMMRKANPKPKKVARLMSAKPQFPGRVSECKRLMNYKTLNTEKNLSDYDYANTAEQSLAKIKDFNYGSDYNSSIVETQRFSEVKPRVKSSYSKFRGFKI